MSFEGKTYVITGAGSGIGRATSKLLAAESANVVVADVNVDGGNETVAMITDAGGKAAFFEANVTNEAAHDALVRFAVETFGSLDGAVNNAAVGQAPGRIHEMTNETWDTSMLVNATGVLYGLRAQLKHFLANGGGAIVNTVSVAGFKPIPDRAAYVASKHALVGLTEQAAFEYVGDNIRVNGVAPGLTMTSSWAKLSPEVQKSYGGSMPGGRPAAPEEIGEAIVFLLSDKASYITGQILPVENGVMLRGA